MRSAPARLSRVALVLIVAVLAVAAAALSGRLPSVQTHAAAPFIPDDEGRVGRTAGWMQLQWNFVGPYGVDAPQAWGNLIAAGAPGGDGVIVAVLDTGIAYPDEESRGGASPDLGGTRFVPGYDFVENDPRPADENGHGTHVASTIAEETDNAFGLTGLAYGVRIMPVRVLDRAGDGDAVTIARGLRYAVEQGAKVINLSLNFDMTVTASEIPQLLGALEFAHRKGSLIVAGAGNVGSASVSFPARGPHVLAVGATTEHGCLASYSNHGTGLDLVAPGGGRDADIEDDPLCQPGRPGRSIYQVSLVGLYHDRFDVTGFIGTSMAAPHVAAAAALVVASGVLGANPSPDAIEQRLEQTARDLGRSGYDSRYGWGLIDAATATSPGRAERPASIYP
jgi:serine protease